MCIPNQIAPGALEHVRRFVNTWCIPNDTRIAEDELPSLTAAGGKWNAVFPYPLGSNDTPAVLTRFRDDLRHALECPNEAEKLLGQWVREADVRIAIEAPTGDGPAVRLVCCKEGAISSLLLLVIAAIEAKEWSRLKCCPDCRWCFFDSTKNGRKRWCGMTKGGPGGRACGTIAKVRRYRERQKAPELGLPEPNTTR